MERQHGSVERTIASVIALLVLGGAALFLGFGGHMKMVETGKVVSCKHCGNTIEDTVHEIKVPFWDAKNHKVTRVSKYCLPCANQEVQTKKQVNCSRCSRTYKVVTVTSCRHQELKDRTVTEGYCSDRCEQLARAGRAADKALGTAGEVFGRASKRFGEGILRGLDR